jgi:excisionase family DNA binding protein
MKRGRQSRYRIGKPLELRRKTEEGEQQLAPIPQRPQPLLLSPAEVARALDLSRSTIYELMRAGTFPTIHIGRSARIPLKAVEAWVDQQTSQGLQS